MNAVSAAEKQAVLAHYAPMADHAQQLAQRPTDHRRVAAWLATLAPAALLIEAQQLARDAALLAGVGHTMQDGCGLLMTSLGDATVAVEYEYSPGSPSQTSGPPERCYEGDPEECNILGVFVNGVWIDAEVIAEDVRDRWTQEVIDHEAAQAEIDRADWEDA
jgi:hypothetical protein